MKKLLVFLGVFLTHSYLFSQCAVFAPGMSITQVNPNTSPTGEDVTKAIDGQTSTKYLNFNILNTGLTVNTNKPGVVVNRFDLTTANDFPERDPISYQIQGSNNGTSWSAITSGTVPCNSTRFLTRSFTFSNTVSYSWFRIVFPSVCNTSLANSMQLAEVQLYSSATAPTITISQNTNNVCQGSLISFSSSITNGGTSPTYQWRLNGNNITGATSSTWSSTTLTNGSTISCVMTSNSTCKTTATVGSNGLVQSIQSKVTPSVTIVGLNTVNRKDSMTFSCNGFNIGASPSYWWYRNSVLQSTTPTWNTIATTTGVDLIEVKVKTSLTCVTQDTAFASFNTTVLSLKDVTYKVVGDSVKFVFTKDQEDWIAIYSYDAIKGTSTLLSYSDSYFVTIPHISKYYYVVGPSYSRFIGPLHLPNQPSKPTISTKQLLGQFTN